MSEQGGQIEIRPMRETDLQAVADLIRAGYRDRSEESILWALRKSPIFRLDLSAVAVERGKIVGCWLSTVQDLKVAPGLVLPARSGLVVVHPKYRRRGIGSRLYRWSRQSTAGREICLGFGVSAPQTHRVFWSKVARARSLPDTSITYTKILSPLPLLQEAGGLSNAGTGALTVLFELTGLPPVLVALERSSVTLLADGHPDMVVRAEISSYSYRSVLVSLLVGRVRITGIRHLPRLLARIPAVRRLVEVLKMSLKEPPT